LWFENIIIIFKILSIYKPLFYDVPASIIKFNLEYFSTRSQDQCICDKPHHRIAKGDTNPSTPGILATAIEFDIQKGIKWEETISQCNEIILIFMLHVFFLNQYNKLTSEVSNKVIPKELLFNLYEYYIY
jgi:hypothetical protein